MRKNRIIVGSFGSDESVRLLAKKLLEAGHEVVYVGGSQRPEHLLSAAIAEDSHHIVVDGDQVDIERLTALSQREGEESPSIHTDLAFWV